MTPLKKFSHSIISHKALASFARNTMSQVAVFKEDAFISRQMATLMILLEELDAAFQRILANKLTLKVNEIDLHRDKLIVSLRALLSAIASQDFINAKKAEAAKAILVHMDKMDERVTSIGLQEESAEIRAFLSAVRKLDQNTIQTSMAASLITNLEETQNEFDVVFEEKNNSSSTAEDPRHIRAIRKDLTIRIEALLSYVNINGVDLPNEYSETIENLNSLITDVMAKAKADQTRKENADLTAE